MSEVAVHVEHLAKLYRIGRRERYTTLRDTLVRALKVPFHNSRTNGGQPLTDHIWALQDVSFQVKRGEVVGIIGRNGAGKTTLLKILSRITKPTAGRAKINGRVGSLLEVGTGFHSELTGRENIYLNGAILGMKKVEIDRKFDEIVAFAEVEPFMDTPVKHYSSGMHMRLAFAVAAHLEPEILLVDEVLAVGDVEFQKKCLGKIGDVAKKGRTVLFVSHNVAAVQILCTHVIHLEYGRIVGQGDAAQEIDRFLNASEKTESRGAFVPVELGPQLTLRKIEFYPNPVNSGAPLNFAVELWSSHPACIEAIALLIFSSLGVRTAILDLRRSESTYRLNRTQSCAINGSIASLPLVEGTYDVGLYVVCGETSGNFLNLVKLEVRCNRVPGEIVPYPPSARGVVDLNFSFSVWKGDT
ncbi:MAG: ABC transporter ATP-binding protein [Candidatus Binatia bacterium]